MVLFSISIETFRQMIAPNPFIFCTVYGGYSIYFNVIRNTTINVKEGQKEISEDDLANILSEYELNLLSAKYFHNAPNESSCKITASRHLKLAQELHKYYSAS
jgi:hypothetical protein